LSNHEQPFDKLRANGGCCKFGKLFSAMSSGSNCAYNGKVVKKSAG
jgi:hypothetical protein